MPESRPRRPLADGLSRACFDGDLASVQQYLAEGADLLGRVRRPGAHLGGPRLAISRHTDEQAVISVERRRLRSRAGDALWLI